MFPQSDETLLRIFPHGHYGVPFVKNFIGMFSTRSC